MIVIFFNTLIYSLFYICSNMWNGVCAYMFKKNVEKIEKCSLRCIMPHEYEKDFKRLLGNFLFIYFKIEKKSLQINQIKSGIIITT